MNHPTNTADDELLKILKDFFEAAYSQREADVDTPPKNNLIYSEALQAIKHREQALLRGLLEQIPSVWETPELREEPTNRQLGYNDYRKEVVSVIEAELEKLK